MIHRVYIAGPYSAPTLEEREANTKRAARATVDVMLKGHDAHCPHCATHLPDVIAGGNMDYERWMRLDFGIIEHWATALYVVASSPGTDREVAFAVARGIPVWRSIDEVPEVPPAE